MVFFLSNKRQCTIALTVVVLIMLVGLLPFPNRALAQSAVALDPTEGLLGTKITAQAEDTINGEWELDSQGYRYLRSDGSTVDENVRGTLVARFSQVENEFTGSYVSTFSDLCSNVEIKGSVQNNQVTWVVHFNAPCECQGAETMFEGTLSQDGNTMTGTISPVRPPPSPDCKVWWANVTGTKVSEPPPPDAVPTITLDPAEGTPSTEVTVWGSGWTAQETVSLWLGVNLGPDGSETADTIWYGLGEVTAGDDGSFTATVAVPAEARNIGVQKVVIDTAEATWQAQADFQVIDPAESSPPFNPQVPAMQPWTDTGLDLKQGDHVPITASGMIGVGLPSGYTPAGDPECQGSLGTPHVAPGLPCWSLIGRIADGAPFFVGAENSFVAEAPGRLYLGANDETDSFGDNSGNWTVDISFTGRKPITPIYPVIQDGTFIRGSLPDIFSVYGNVAYRIPDSQTLNAIKKNPGDIVQVSDGQIAALFKGQTLASVTTIQLDLQPSPVAASSAQLNPHVQIKVSTEGIAKEALRALSISFTILEAAGCVVPGAPVVVGSIALGPAGISSGAYLTLVNVVYNPFCVQLVKSITLDALGVDGEGADFFIGPN